MCLAVLRLLLHGLPPAVSCTALTSDVARGGADVT